MELPPISHPDIPSIQWLFGSQGSQTTQGWFPFQTDHFTFKHDVRSDGRKEYMERGSVVYYIFQKNRPQPSPFGAILSMPASHQESSPRGLVISRPIHLSSDLLIWIDILVTIKQNSIKHPIVVELVKNLICYRFSMLLCFSNQGLQENSSRAIR